MKTMAVRNPKSRLGKFLAHPAVSYVALGAAFIGVMEMGLARTLGG